MRKVGQRLQEHLRTIGITAIFKEGSVPWVEQTDNSWSEEVLSTKSAKLADFQVSLGRISSIEVRRESWAEASLYLRSEDGSRATNYHSEVQITYVMNFEPEVEIPLSFGANTILDRTLFGKVKSLTWHAFPFLSYKLNGDVSLNSKLLAHMGKDLVGDLRIRRLPSNRIGITTKYHRRKLPSRELLGCIEDIAAHVDDVVTERSRKGDIE